MLLLRINGVDMTQFVNYKSYSVNAVRKYVSWKDGNMKEHRKYYKNAKRSGEFTINCSGDLGMTTLTFLTNLEEATDDDGLTTMALWINNETQFKQIECYYEITGKKHIELNDEEFLDQLTIKVTEA